MTTSRFIAGTAAAAASLAAAAGGATFTVDTTADTPDSTPGDGICADFGGNCSLRAAVMEADALAGADTILLPAGDHLLTRSGTDDSPVNGDLDLTGDVEILGAGADVTTVRVGGLVFERAFDVRSGSALIEGLTIRDGFVANLGGGIRVVAGATLDLRDSVITENIAFGGLPKGLGLHNAGTATLTNVIISDNGDGPGAGFAGGGIMNESGGVLTMTGGAITGNGLVIIGGGIRNEGEITLSGVLIDGNTASNGGGLSNVDTATLTDVTVTNNVCTSDGGGIFNFFDDFQGPNILTYTGGTIDGNTASRGGGIYSNGTAVLADLVISNNVGNNFGGGIYVGVNGSLTLARSTVVGNSSNNGGGVDLLDNSTATLTNVTVSGNTAVNVAGIRNGGTLTLISSAVIDNMCPGGCIGGGGVVAPSGVNDATLINTVLSGNSGGDCFPTVVSNGHNLSSDSSCGLNGPGDMQNTDPLLGALTDNGGATPTHLPLDRSPLIDAGDPLDFPSTDQRGVARPEDGDGDNVALPDIGPVELAPPALDCNHNGEPDNDEIAAEPGLDADGTGILDECEDRGDLDGSGIVDVEDLEQLLALWGPCPAPPDPCPADLDGDGVVGVLDLLTVLGNWG